MGLRTLLWVLVLTSLSCSSPEQRRAGVLAEVERLKVQGQLQLATGVLQAALQSSPNNRAFLVALADLKLRAGACRAAGKTLKRIRKQPGYILLQARMVARCQAPMAGLEAAWVAGLGRDLGLLEDLPFLARSWDLETRSRALLMLLARIKTEGDQRTLQAWLHALRGAPQSFHCGVIAEGLGSEAEGWKC